MLSKTALRTTARILLVTYLFFILEGPVRASDFDSALNAGKSIGTSSVSDYNPTNLNNTLQGKGLGTASTLTPQAGQAATDRGHYESFYTSPGGMSSASSEVGDFVNSSYQTRDKYDLSQDPTFGNKCLETDADGKCVKWSTSNDVIKNSYPDCDTVQIPRYDDPPTEATCIGTRTSQMLDCPVRTVIRVETETITTPCSESNIGYKPGQIYAVCKDYYEYFKYYIKNDSLRNDCNCDNMPGYWCHGHPTSFTYGSPPADARLMGTQAELQTCTEADGWDYGNMNFYDWYSSYKNSVIERAYVDYDSPCGDVSRFTESSSECSLARIEQCDPNGNNCLLTLDNAEPTGAVASMQYLTYTSSSMTSIPCSSCEYECTEWGWEECLEYSLVCDPPVPSTVCSGSCPAGAALVSSPSNSTVQTGTKYSASPSVCSGCEPCLEPPCNPCALTIPVSYQVYYADPRVCNNFSGSIENYALCMDGTNITLNGTGITKTQQFSSSTSSEYGNTVVYVRAYGGPDIRPFLNGWYVKSQFSCFHAEDNCQSLRDQGCRMYSQSCADPDDQACPVVNYTYRCGGTGGILGYDVAIVCSGQIRCMGSDCKDTLYNANMDFNKIPQAVEIMNALRMDGTELEIFPGKVRECQSGPKQCCNANTGGVSIGQYVMAAKAAAEMYSTLSTGIAATGQAMAAAATTTINTVASSAGLATVNTTITGTTVVSTFAGGSTVGAGGVITTATVEGASGAAVSVVGGGTAGIGSSTMLAAAATCMAVAGLIVAAYVIATTVYEMMFACTNEDMATSIDLGFKLCHKVGSRKNGQFLGFNLKQRDVYCCFSSILARLVHEQGRTQISKSWGTADTPSCGGFSYGEFAVLDFMEMDLTEYMQYVQSKTQLSPEESQDIMTRVQQQVQNP